MLINLVTTSFTSTVNKLSIDQALSFPLGCLILERHDDAANEWGTLGSRDLTPSAIYYEPLIIWLTAVLHRLNGTELYWD